jgi:hypothetical protein
MSRPGAGYLVHHRREVTSMTLDLLTCCEEDCCDNESTQGCC